MGFHLGNFLSDLVPFALVALLVVASLLFYVYHNDQWLEVRPCYERAAEKYCGSINLSLHSVADHGFIAIDPKFWCELSERRGGTTSSLLFLKSEHEICNK